MKTYTYEYLERNGRLGNQLWQIAAMVGEAERHGGVARFRPDWTYRPYFSVPDELFEQPSGEIVDGGTDYYQEYHYFENVADEIRDYFAPSEDAYEVLERAIDRLGMANRTTCSLHVRRGDYLKYPNHFPITSSRFYQAAVADVVGDWHDTLFVVFSDDTEWCRKNMDYLGLSDHEAIVVDGIVTPVEVVDRVDPPMDWLDLFLIAECDRHILSNSTFAWWGAYLSEDKAPIYPSRWFGREVPNGSRWELAMPDGWRRFRS